jgi:hypothetical protein
MRCLRTTILSIALAGPSMIVVGCGGTNDPDAKLAEEAVGLKPGEGDKTTAKTKREVIVVDDKKIIDKETGKTLKEEVKSKDYTIEVQKTEKTDVDIEAGETKTTVNGRPVKSGPK